MTGESLLLRVVVALLVVTTLHSCSRLSDAEDAVAYAEDVAAAAIARSTELSDRVEQLEMDAEDRQSGYGRFRPYTPD